MPDLIPALRKEALRLFLAGVEAADPAKALMAQLVSEPLQRPEGKLYLIAVGKAAVPMLEQALRQVPKGITPVALAVTNPENARDIPGATVLKAAHPVPDKAGAAAGRAVLDMLSRSTPADKVVALISGGGSALLPAPVEGVTLADKAKVSEILLAAGFNITEMNMVRQQLSQLKGGGFLRHSNAPVEAYILSDVIGDDLRVVASGPTLSPIGTRTEAAQLLKARNVFDRMPASVQACLNRPDDTAARHVEARNTLICSNRQSLEAMRLAAGKWDAQIIADDLTGDVEDAADLLLNIALKAPPETALLFGGETTVTLKGAGRGGRNQELALRFAAGAKALGRDWVFLSGGTDGRDGPTDAAGGIVDSGTVERVSRAGGALAAFIDNNDSYTALAASNDLLMTGATGTNVADLQIFLRGPMPK